jgi:hypothetical protein
MRQPPEDASNNDFRDGGAAEDAVQLGGKPGSYFVHGPKGPGETSRREPSCQALVALEQLLPARPNASVLNWAEKKIYHWSQKYDSTSFSTNRLSRRQDTRIPFPFVAKHSGAY